MDVKEILSDYAEMTEEALEKYLPPLACLQSSVIKAARYSLLAGGKRIRPALVLEFCRICGGEISAALPVACALEMTHTFSLIHDDLPCMDDDDLRRGQPSCHKKYGEATALLAGDALAVMPYRIIAEAAEKKLITQDAALKLITLLADNVGVFGMIGGQTLDLEFENIVPTTSAILEMYRMKTGALLEFACKAGCIAAGADVKKQLAAAEYGRRLGVAFQIIDDIMDITLDTETLGKPVGSDAQSGKHTYVYAVGIDKAREQAESLTQQAIGFLDEFTDVDFLTELAKQLLYRQH
ncbi:MAG: polyprenyl synthetase family protein [Oscillospiraceae bacterium]